MSPIPHEVELVERVRGCRTCRWFWGTTPPYDPYTAYDFATPFPAELLVRRPQTTQATREPWLTARAAGDSLVEPSIMRGCRKAPIMTIGINPNLTAFWPTVESACWAYPKLGSDASYAYYHRHRSIHQENVDPVMLRDNLVPGTELRAKRSGWITSTQRSSSHRWAQVTVVYEDDREPEVIEIDWTPETRFVFVVPTTRSQALDETPPTLQPGQVIGGQLRSPTKGDLPLFESAVGYYQRFLPVLEGLRRSRPELAELDLRMGEDVCEHDNVHCPSAGWSSFDVPTDRVAHNCVGDHAYIVSQVVQTQPAVIVLVSRSSLSMFLEPFRSRIEVPAGIDGFSWSNDVYQLLRDTVANRIVLRVQEGQVSFASRIVIVPHFSYPDNFVLHARVAQCEWLRLANDHPADVQQLRKHRRIREVSEGFVAIALAGEADELRPMLSPELWSELIKRHVDPYALMTKALLEELDAGNLRVDAQTGHFARTAGPCRFCDNERWQFPEGCGYGKTTEPDWPEGTLESVVQAIRSRG